MTTAQQIIRDNQFYYPMILSEAKILGELTSTTFSTTPHNDIEHQFYRFLDGSLLEVELVNNIVRNFRELGA